MAPKLKIKEYQPSRRASPLPKAEEEPLTPVNNATCTTPTPDDLITPEQPWSHGSNSTFPVSAPHSARSATVGYTNELQKVLSPEGHERKQWDDPPLFPSSGGFSPEDGSAKATAHPAVTKPSHTGEPAPTLSRLNTTVAMPPLRELLSQSPSRPGAAVAESSLPIVTWTVTKNNCIYTHPIDRTPRFRTTTELETFLVNNGTRHRIVHVPNSAPASSTRSPARDMAAEATRGDQAARVCLLADGSEPCYPAGHAYPLEKLDAEHQEIVKFWRFFEPAGADSPRGAAESQQQQQQPRGVLEKQLARWKEFRRWQTLLDGDEAERARRVHETRRRFWYSNLSSIVARNRSSKAWDWLEYQYFELKQYESLAERVPPGGEERERRKVLLMWVEKQVLRLAMAEEEARRPVVIRPNARSL